MLKLDPNTIPLNAPFDTMVIVCPKNETLPKRLQFDATMPAHKHGMNYAVKPEQIDPQTHELKNIVFHMPGVWRVEVTAYDGQNPHYFTYDFDLE